jgi:NAD(P)-dependent dehydrogenase (short-subunit alcohol dehydrogenase family)
MTVAQDEIERITGSRPVAFAGDLQVATSRSRLVKEVGRIDVVVNNAGGFVRPSTTLNCTLADWESQISLNLTVPFQIVQAVLPQMIERGWGRIVNIGSIVASAPQLGNSIAYVAAKSGLVGLTRQLAAEVAAHGITANVINPGTIHTEHLQDYFEASGVTANDLAQRIPVGRLGTPSEVAALIPYLVSDAGAFLTGAVIDVNGGAVHA